MGKSGVKIIKKVTRDDDVVGVLKNAFGLDEDHVNLEVCLQKYKDYRKELLAAINAMKEFHSQFFALVDMIKVKNEFAIYINRLVDVYRNKFPVIRMDDNPMARLSVNFASDAKKQEIANIYREIRNLSEINDLIVLCDRLKPIKKHIENAESLDDKFTSGFPIFEPFAPHVNVNFTFLLTILGENQAAKAHILQLLHNMYTITFRIFNIKRRPEIDVDEFVDYVSSRLELLKKQIPRCDGAFRKIDEALSSLKSNFGEYYTDYVATNNPSIMLETFIVDVAKNSSSTARLAGEFNTILKYFQTTMANNPEAGADPRAQKLLSVIAGNCEILEKEEAKQFGSSSTEVDLDMSKLKI